MIEIVQVLALKRSPDSEQLGLALWSAFEEIENFYNLGEQRIHCTRFVLTLDSGGSLSEVIEPLGTGTSGSTPGASDTDLWLGLQGKYRRTIDQEMLGSFIRNLLPPSHKKAFLTIFTDQEIEPPSGWRYVIWDTISNGSVVSAAPTDPNYWRERSSNRFGTIKHRMRTAGMSVTGIQLGLQRCENPGCLLFADVGSTIVLDSMVVLGAEHGWSSLTGFGYSPRPADPAQVQTPVLIGSITEPSTIPLSLEQESEWNTYE
jgi:hypothetical protein